MLSGSTLKLVMDALEVGPTELALEAGFRSKSAVMFAVKAKVMRAQTEQRYLAALKRIAERRVADRTRAQTESLLELLEVVTT